MTHFETAVFSVKNGREENQDRAFFMTLVGESKPQELPVVNMSVLCVMDGVSHGNGKMAVDIAERAALRPSLAHLLGDAYELMAMEPEKRKNEIYAQLREAVRKANDAIAAELGDNGYTTATVSFAVVLGATVYAANVGDSPILLFPIDQFGRMEDPVELFRCDNLAGEQIRNGEITKEQALLEKKGWNQLTKCVLGQKGSDEELFTATPVLIQAALLLIGTDGALSVYPDCVMKEIVERNTNGNAKESTEKIALAIRDTVLQDDNAKDNASLIAQWIYTS